MKTRNAGVDFADLLEAIQRAPWEALSEKTRFGPETVRFSVRRLLDGWRREIVPRAVSGRSVLAVLPSNTPAALVHVTAAAAMAGARLTIRPSRRDEEFAREWAAWMRDSAGIGIEIEMNPRFSAYDRMIVFGSDETVGRLAKEFGRSQDFRGYGSRFSVAVIDRVSALIVAKIADDVVAWDQMGCLSIQTVAFIGELSAAQSFCSLLAAEMEDRARKVPRALPPRNVSLEIRIRRADAMTRPGGTFWGPEENTAWSVCFDDSSKIEETPLHRTVWVKRASNVEEVIAALAPYRAHLEAIGVACSDTVRAMLDSGFGDEPDRLMEVGTLQSHPMTRRHGGVSPLVDWLGDDRG